MHIKRANTLNIIKLHFNTRVIQILRLYLFETKSTGCQECLDRDPNHYNGAHAPPDVVGPRRVFLIVVGHRGIVDGDHNQDKLQTVTSKRSDIVKSHSYVQNV